VADRDAVGLDDVGRRRDPVLHRTHPPLPVDLHHARDDRPHRAKISASPIARRSGAFGVLGIRACLSCNSPIRAMHVLNSLPPMPLDLTRQPALKDVQHQVLASRSDIIEVKAAPECSMLKRHEGDLARRIDTVAWLGFALIQYRELYAWYGVERLGRSVWRDPRDRFDEAAEDATAKLFIYESENGLMLIHSDGLEPIAKKIDEDSAERE